MTWLVDPEGGARVGLFGLASLLEAHAHWAGLLSVIADLGHILFQLCPRSSFLLAWVAHAQL